MELCAIGVGISLNFGFLVGEWAGGGLCDLIGCVSVASDFVDRLMKLTLGRTGTLILLRVRYHLTLCSARDENSGFKSYEVDPTMGCV